MDNTVTTIEITLSRVIKEDGSMAIKVRTPASFNAVEALGLLEAARWAIFRDMDDSNEHQ